MAARCSICGVSLLAWPDDDATCSPCEAMNFAGDEVRAEARVPRSVWGATPPDGRRALTCVEGPWTWLPEDSGMEEHHRGH